MNRTVLKPGTLQATTRGGCNVDLRDISQQARSILENAKTEARRIVDTARRESDVQAKKAQETARNVGLEEGMEAGRKEGFAAALAQAREQFTRERAELVTTLEKMVESFKASRERLLVEARQDIIALTIAISARVIEQLSTIDGIAPASAVDACREAIALIGVQTEAVILAHVDDCSAIERFCQTLHANLGAAGHLKLVPDPNIPRAGVVVTTADGRIDATIHEKIRRIADELAADWKRRLAPQPVEEKPV